jgi:hypothetical protein
MELLILFAGLVFSRVQARAADEVGDIIHENTIGRGVDLLRRFAKAARSDDPEAAEAAADEYAKHLEAHPEEAAHIVPAILHVVAPHDPMVVLEALIQLSCLTAARVQQRPIGGGPAGCAAFAGSLVDPGFITIVDVRDKDDNLLPLPGVVTAGLEPYFDFDATLDAFYMLDQRPRMLIVKPTNPEDRDDLVLELNAMLLDRDRPGAPILHLKVAELLDAPRVVTDGIAAPSPRGVMRRVSYVYADRVDIDYSDPEKQRRLKAAASLADRLAIQTEEADVDRLKEAERREFLISAVDGPRALFESLQSLARDDAALHRRWREDWAELSEGFAKR